MGSRHTKIPTKNIETTEGGAAKFAIGPLTDELADRQREVLIEIEENLEKQEIYWVQRSRANWLKFGDRNTGFFNNFATARKKRNFIRRLMDEAGQWRDDNTAMGHLIENYFHHLFTSEVSVLALNVLNKVKPKVSDYMNEALLALYLGEEVKKALFSIGISRPQVRMVSTLFSSRNSGT